MNLRPYQTDGVNAIRQAFSAGNRSVIYVLPTGGGKTVLFTYMAINAAAKGKRVLILTHRVELLRQAANKLRESGCDPGLISPHYTPSPMSPVQVASIQTVRNRLSKIHPPELIVVDECHHSTASTWAEVINAYPRAHVCGVTATPCRSDGRGLGDIFQTMIEGPQIYELMDAGYLVRARVFSTPYTPDMDGVHSRAGDYVRSELDAVMGTPKITGDAIAHYRQLCDGMPAVAYCVSVQHAEKVAADFRAAGYRSWSVDGSMDDAQRAALISGLGTGAVQVLTSCDLIGEGLDVPAIRAAILLRPTQSLSLYLQQVGRALRPATGKTEAIILDHAGNVQRHGLPDEYREWTLDVTKKKRKSSDEKTIPTKLCPACYLVHRPAPVCPHCGHKHAVEGRKVEQVDGQLMEVTAIQRERKREQGKAQTLEDLKRIERIRGYKPGWAQHVFNARKNILR